MNERRAKCDQTETKGSDGKEDPGSQKAHCDHSRQLEANARNGEYQDGEAVSVSLIESEVLLHAGDRRTRYDATIQQIETAK